MLGPRAYLPTDECERVGVRIFTYQGGFLHQKAFVFDDSVAAIGTVNFDNRSFHLNFEVMAYVASSDFVRLAAEMLGRDFARSSRVNPNSFARMRLPKRILVKLSRLFAAVL